MCASHNTPPTPLRVLLYYQFAPIADPQQFRAEHEALCRSLGLLGRILVATEGLNGSVCGSPQATDAYQQAVRALPGFESIEFKTEEVDRQAFHKLNVRVKPELVHMGWPQQFDVRAEGAPYIEPEEMRDLLRNTPDDVVIIDTRSYYEYRVGRFKGAIALEIDTFRELPDRLRDLEHLKDKTVITYCTGGIRCEKLTPLMRRQGFEKIYQLHGGILRYAAEVGGENFEGRCYVFDERVLTPVNHVNPTVVGQCDVCQSPTEHMVNCANALCNKQILLCDKCAEELEGTCSTACHQSPRRRVYDGSGLYIRGRNSKVYANKAG